MNDVAPNDVEEANFLVFQGADEQMVGPAWKEVARYEVDSADCNGWFPVEFGLLHARLGVEFGNNAAVVVPSVGDDRPAEVLGFAEPVEFISTHRAMFRFPDATCGWVNRETLRVSVSVGKDRREGIEGGQERIVVGDTAVSIDPVDFSVRLTEVLSSVPVTSIAHRKVKAMV